MVNRPGCTFCQSLPDGLPESGTLYLAAPLLHTQESIASLLRDMGLACEQPDDNILRVTFGQDRLPEILEHLDERLTGIEVRETRVLLLRDGETPELSSFLMADRLASLVKRSRSRWLVDILATNALVTHFQPIVASQDPADIYGYEALTRGVADDGQLIPPLTLYEAAVTEDLLSHLDRMARIGAIRAAAGHGIASSVFINFTPSSIYTPEFCLRSTIGAMRRTDLTPRQIIFEVVETERIDDLAHLEGILGTYREQGFRVALDDLGVGFASLNMLYSLRPDFVKLDRSLVQGVDSDSYKATIASRLLDTALSLGVESVAEGVETEAEWRWLTANGATYQQGFLFAHPATPPPLPAPLRRAS